MQVSAVIFTATQEQQLLAIGSIISSLHRWFIYIHLSYPYLTALSSLFLLPFNTCLLLNKHREAVYSLRLHSDCGRPAAIFRTTFLCLISKDTQFTAHLAPNGDKKIFSCSFICGEAESCKIQKPHHCGFCILSNQVTTLKHSVF